MTSKSRSEKDPAISPQTRLLILRLAATLLDRYQVHAPPVPIERMLTDPLLDLLETNPRKISSGVGHGIYRYSPRLAQARLLYRTLSDSSAARQAGLDAPWPASRREVKYFARCLLMPEDWIRALPAADRLPETIGEKFQVPAFEAIIRLTELDLAVPGGEPIDPDQF